MNWEPVLIAFVASLPPTIVAAAALIQAIKTHRSVNGMKHELVESVRKEATAQATLDEKGAQSVREGEAAKATMFATTVVSQGTPVTEAERLRDRETLIKDMP